MQAMKKSNIPTRILEGIDTPIGEALSVVAVFAPIGAAILAEPILEARVRARAMAALETEGIASEAYDPETTVSNNNVLLIREVPTSSSTPIEPFSTYTALDYEGNLEKFDGQIVLKPFGITEQENPTCLIIDGDKSTPINAVDCVL